MKKNNEFILGSITFGPKIEKELGITPKELEKVSLFSKYKDFFTIHKSSKKGQSSFRITKDLLENLIATSLKIQKQPKLIITINSGSDEYILICSLTKNKVS